MSLPLVYDPKSNNPLWIDVRELNLKYQIPVKKVQKFFEGLKQGKVLATRCPKCNTIYFPPQDDCPKCKMSNLDWVEMPEEGEIIAFTVINVKPPSFSKNQDYVVGIAKMRNGVNVLAWVNSKEVKVSMKVKLKVVKREPEGYLTYEFFPA
ncbi:3-hydroxybutyryl-CoA epimerase [Sulfolobus sp. E1]|nr:Zn-ribbon domain-containing OB-fold protein [Sulfolobus sp. A20]TRM74111.1 3-hydroxybutyryl-CoA epimerase [Sulfolobus sp. E5]TRM81778.1 3-hydroxybutyryl-CoA epimerase [Sulfolobus sp. D5]TRM83562.1 3-hydroxybutyryl-CoA epimerase [Sulfolobus sp. F3]TRM85833.1 3-hydroxybutyryl-CoA epimerase [Sulfolobus sp. E3]TRM86285.1 3-hydroxybutyryl-CoA epimerase [Sulfolobus sp. C3]TRM91912.1 3-hydroxybutyryl-CoA epimerase [Sulfolobus sp. A20-N-G8]TRM98116.1 3-hydroxybutyryl-CoA epimerase [Sulfolobus sp.